MRKLYILVLLIMSAVFSYNSFAQNTGTLRTAPVSELTTFRPTLTPENSGQIVGVVRTEKGKIVENANVILNNGYFFYDATSNKKGEYRARTMFGEFVVEVSAPGYEKYVGEVYMSKGKTLTRDITLKPIVKGAEKMKIPGNKSFTNGNSILFNINGKHPAYEGCSMLDVLQNLPLFDEVSGKALKVAGSENVTIHFNSKANKAQPQMLVNMLRSIPAESVQSVKVSSWGGQGESPILVYLHYKE